MAKIIRSAKSAKDWSTNELLAYNITIQTRDVTKFFSHELCSDDLIDPGLLLSSHNSFPTEISPRARRFLAYLNLILRHSADSFLTDFANGVLKAVGFDRHPNASLLVLCTLPFTMCGDINQKASPDILVRSNHLVPMVLFLVQRKKPTLPGPEPPLIAGAIAAFQYNNQGRIKMGLQALDTMTIPCIAVEGTRPLFYKVPVTKRLGECVATGQFPEEETVVIRCGPPAPSEALVGMESLDYRRTALRYYYTFRDLAEDCWAHILTDCEGKCFHSNYD